MIRAVAWHCADHYGVLVPGGHSWQKPSPAASQTADILAIIERPVKYFGRTTVEARSALCAASVALRAVAWSESGAQEIGLISSSPDGCLRDNREYFRDYVDCGRTLGRGNLFIYTLPTSVAGEIAIALSLTGPCFFIHDNDTPPLASLARHAARLMADGEADRMLAIWCDPQAALCLAIDSGDDHDGMLSSLTSSPSIPSQLVRALPAMVPRS